MTDTEGMFGPKDRLGFTEDDLNLNPSRDTRARNDKLRAVRNGVLAINLAMAVVLIPAFVVLLVTAVRSNDPERWTNLWIGASILMAVAFVIEVFFVTRLLRSAGDTPGIFTGDERA